jgi:DNA-binding NarL/FixJ family response regulator
MEAEKSCSGHVVVCTDRELLFLAIERMVEGTFRCERVTAEGLGGMFQRFEAVAPDSVILDTETSVPQLMRRIGKGLPTVPVIVWQRANATEASLHALELGACGILHDSSTAADITTCLTTVQEGHVWVPRSVAQASLDFRRYRLSPREWQAMKLVSQGYCNKEIAYSMGITEGTTKVYLSRMFDKLEVSDRYELALLGLRHFSHANPQESAAGDQKQTSAARPIPKPLTEAGFGADHSHSVFVYRPPVRLSTGAERPW